MNLKRKKNEQKKKKIKGKKFIIFVLNKYLIKNEYKSRHKLGYVYEHINKK